VVRALHPPGRVPVSIRQNSYRVTARRQTIQLQIHKLRCFRRNCFLSTTKAHGPCCRTSTHCRLHNQYGVQFAGQVKVDVAGDYTFYVRSNDGSRLTVADQLVVDNDGRHGAIEKQGSVSLQPGVHPIVLEYFQNGGSEALQVFWSGPGFARELVPDNVIKWT